MSILNARRGEARDMQKAEGRGVCLKKGKVFIIVSLLLIWGAFPPLLAAEEGEADEDLVLPEITIYGEEEDKKELLDPGPGVSSHTLDQEEILRPAGSLEDLHRVIQTLPGVVKQGDLPPSCISGADG